MEIRSLKMDIELQKRLRRIENNKYEFETLTPFDHLLLFLAGLFFPLILMLFGWFL